MTPMMGVAITVGANAATRTKAKYQTNAPMTTGNTKRRCRFSNAWNLADLSNST